MRWTTTTAGAVALLTSDLVAHVDALNIPRAKAGKGYLSVPISTVDGPKKMVQRDDKLTIDAILDNRGYFYTTEILFGEPPQSVQVLVDTGSNELWVNPDCDTVRSNQQYKTCVEFGEYDPSKSKTPPIGPFGREVINYGDASDASTQTSATIHYYADTLTFGEAELVNQTFGVVSSSEGIAQGIFGLSPDLHDGFTPGKPYSLVLNSMAEQGYIASRAFSLDLRHTESETGAVIYGGLDRNKFVGKLEKRDIVRGESGEYRLAVEMTSLGITIDGDEEEFDLDDADVNVMLDSGTSFTRMHEDAAMPIFEALDARVDGEGYYYTRCSMRTSSGSVDFGFGNKIIRVPFSDFILDVGNSLWCYIGLIITTDQQILGDTVLRAGYFVFDWDNEAVHIAQAASCGKDDIVAIGSGSNAVPSVTGRCDMDDATQTESAMASSTDSDSETETDAPTFSSAAAESAYTTTYTISSCPPFVELCTVGAVTTETFGPVRPTVTVTKAAGGSSDDNDDDSAAWHAMPMSWVFAVVGGFALGLNII